MSPCSVSNILTKPLIKREKIIPPPFHIKLVKQFVKALRKNGEFFNSIFPNLSEKFKAEFFYEPQIYSLLKKNKKIQIGEPEVVQNFFWKHKSRNHKDVVTSLIASFEDNGPNISIKIHFLFTYLGRFLENV